MGLLDLLFPPRCAACRQYGAGWCTSCAATVEPIDATTLDGIPLIAGGRLAGPLQQAIHTFKYGGRRDLGDRLAPILVRAAAGSRTRFTAVTSIPLHPARLKQRGFNQAGRLGAAVAKGMNLPMLNGLSRVRATPAQVGLSQADRRVNVLGAFSWTAAAPPPRGLVLVDDVCTTGATLQAAAEAVRQAGGSPAAYLVLARAQTLPAPAVTLPDSYACP